MEQLCAFGKLHGKNNQIALQISHKSRDEGRNRGMENLSQSWQGELLVQTMGPISRSDVHPLLQT